MILLKQRKSLNKIYLSQKTTNVLITPSYLRKYAFTELLCHEQNVT